jgi:hypothetical protein
VSPNFNNTLPDRSHTLAATPNDSSITPQQELPGPANRPTHLNEGEIWVEYHPASGKHPEILRPQCAVMHIVPPAMPYDPGMPPWHPFRTRADFEQVELFLRHDCTDPYINDQLKLIHSSSPLGHSITLKSAKDIHSILAQIPCIEDIPGVRVLNGSFAIPGLIISNLV